MGNIERIVRERAIKNHVQKAILSSLKILGFVSVAVLVPNALQALPTFIPSLRRRRIDSINHSRQRLIEGGFVEYKNGLLKLTSKGENKLRRMESIDYHICKPKKWDGKWRILIFDISEKRKRDRDKLRFILRSIGFFKLQNSVWVYPYDCEDLINLLKTDLHIGKAILYIVADKIEYDINLKKRFDL